MYIGNYRDLTFRVEFQEENYLLTFEDLKRKFAASWNTHAALNGRERIEKNGIKLQDMTCTFHFRSDAGVSAREMIDLLQSYVEDGKSDLFVVGSYCLTGYPWIIVDAGVAYNIIVGDGNIVSASVDVTLKQYF